MSAQNTSKVPIGTVLGEKFRVTREIGRGGMAAVYEAENIVIGKRVAVKVLAAELLTSRVVRERFLREARAAAAIRSQYICDVYDSGTFEERPFLVMELLEGESLYEMMTRVRRLDTKDTLTIVQQVCRGLIQAHEANVIHRDLKPENIFITRTPEGDILSKIVDFGLAKFYEPAGGDAAQVRLTREGALFGTPAYMSPEQAKGQGEVDKRVDLWALGCIVYECLTGATVWNVEQGVAMILAQIASAPLPVPSVLRPDLPRSFDAWFEQALARDPDARFQTPLEFAESLEQALLAEPVPSSARASSVQPLASLLSDPQATVPGSELDPDAATQPAPEVAPSSGTPLEPGPSSSTTETNTAVIPPRSSGQGAGGLVKLSVALAVAIALGAGAYAARDRLFAPPVAELPTVSAPPPRATTPASVSSAAPTASAAPEGPLEAESWARKLFSAQGALADGKPEEAANLFKDAFADGGTSVSRALYNQFGAAVLENPSKCKIAALGRPRPFSATTAISRPAYARLEDGGLWSWVDGVDNGRKRQALIVTVDRALRRTSEPRSITPEATNVRHVQLTTVGSRVALLYWDEGGPDPGVFVRWLGSDGRIAGPARRLSTSKQHEFSPTMTTATGGGYWVAWTEPTEGDMVDLFVRRLTPELEPAAPPVRLTALELLKGVKSGVEQPRIVSSHGQLFVVYSVRRDSESRIELLRIDEQDAALREGADPSRLSKRGDRSLGERHTISTGRGKHTQPRIACATTGCWMSWDNERAGAFVAFLDAKTGEKQWHKEFARKGKRPEVGVLGERGFVAWVDPTRIRLAEVTTDDILESSVVGRVSGFQPYPELEPVATPASFVVAWRDYEAGHLEGFAALAQCP